jgi:hypothetical protein
MDVALQLATCVADLSIHAPLHNTVVPAHVVEHVLLEQI